MQGAKTVAAIALDEATASGGVTQLAGLLAIADPTIAAAAANPQSKLTVFAPTNAAFEALGQPTLTAVTNPANVGLLNSILLKHILGGLEVTAEQALTLRDASVLTLSGQDIFVDGSTGSVLITPTYVKTPAKVIAADVIACNGIIHVIDAVIEYIVTPPPSPVVKARKDPHLHFAHGGRADLRGEDGAIYNFLSAHNVSMNVKTVKADFHWKEQLVHGTRIGAVYWTVKAADGSLINIMYESAEDAIPKAARVAIDGKPKTTVSLNEVFTHADVRVALTREGLKVTNTRWAMGAAPAHFPYAKNNGKKILLDIQATPLYDAENDTVAPHGIFGQSFDGDAVAVDGARDKENVGTKDKAGRVVERTTAAQAEGAIEGTLNDYKMEGMFATNFKYSRFAGAPAAHRDVSKLKGNKHAAAKAPKVTVVAKDHD